MKIMAVDYGDARTGLAVCDRTEFLASPVGQIEEKSMAKVAEKIIYASREFDVGMIVIGLPKNMDGTEGARAQKTRKLAALVELGVQVPIVCWDERRTTVTAAAQLSEVGTFGQKKPPRPAARLNQNAKKRPLPRGQRPLFCAKRAQNRPFPPYLGRKNVL